MTAKKKLSPNVCDLVIVPNVNVNASDFWSRMKIVLEIINWQNQNNRAVLRQKNH
jgi:hypothetical protein